MTARVVWIAEGPDGLGHAVLPGRCTALDGTRVRDIRWSWPVRDQCPDCAALVLWADRPTVRRIPTPVVVRDARSSRAPCHRGSPAGGELPRGRRQGTSSTERKGA